MDERPSEVGRTSWLNGSQYAAPPGPSKPQHATSSKIQVRVLVSPRTPERQSYHDYVHHEPVRENANYVSPYQNGAQRPHLASQVHPRPETAHGPTTAVEAPEPAPRQSTKSAVDYPTLLLALAEDYLTSARRMGPRVASGKSADGLRTYRKLVATSLGCFESVLQVRFTRLVEPVRVVKSPAYLVNSNGGFPRIERLWSD